MEQKEIVESLIFQIKSSDLCNEDKTENIAALYNDYNEIADLHVQLKKLIEVFNENGSRLENLILKNKSTILNQMISLLTELEEEIKS